MSSTTTITVKPAPRVTGDTFIWVLIFGDMCNFAAGFCYYGVMRIQDIQLFQTSQASLSVSTGAANSLILLFSSWLMILAVGSARMKRYRLAASLVVGTGLSGLLFTALKAAEFVSHTQAGIGFMSNNFYTFYYVLTGLHFTHVVVGLGLLACFTYVLASTTMTPTKQFYFETTAIYWHMVDLLWILIFTLLYLLP